MELASLESLLLEDEEDEEVEEDEEEEEDDNEESLSLSLSSLRLPLLRRFLLLGLLALGSSPFSSI